MNDMSKRAATSHEEVRRLALRQMELGRAELASALSRGCTDAAIHAVRVRLKKTRALLRLLDNALGADYCRRQQTALRRLHHALGAARDRAVLISTAERMIVRCRGKLPDAFGRELLRRLNDEHGSALHAARGAMAALKLMELRLTGIEAAIRAAPASRFTRQGVLLAAADEYARVRHRLARAIDAGRDEDLHRLRRAVKRLGYHRRLLRRQWPGDWPLDARRLDKLGDRLGEHQDLCILLTTPARLRDRTTIGGYAAFEAATRRRRDRLARQALKLAGRLLDQRPRRLRQRLSA